MSDNSVAALAVLCIFGAPIAAFIVMRVLAHRERIEMIRRGMVPPQQMSSKAWKNVNFDPAGAGVPPPPQQQQQQAPPQRAAWTAGSCDPDADRSLRKGIMLSLIGLAILIGLSFIGYDTDGPFNSPELHPGPWLLGGLIPMFVGIAQVIVALLSGARLGYTPRPAPPPYPGASAPPPYPGAAGTTRGARPYEPEPRTHSGYEELKRPVPPPDRR
jgi:hypothetical protein